MSTIDDEAARVKALKEEGRKAAFDLQAKAVAEGKPFGWFEALYQNAAGERALVPWSDAAPRFKLEEWLKAHPGGGRPALEVGSGLGDNAALIAAAGYAVTAFDIAPTAVEWARRKHQGSAIRFETADMLSPPAAWRGAFAFVHETYNLQALPRDRVTEAMRSLATLIAPGGTLIVMTRVRLAGEEVKGPPWPLTLPELSPFREAGLQEARLEEFFHGKPEPIRHVMVEYRREEARLAAAY